MDYPSESETRPVRAKNPCVLLQVQMTPPKPKKKPAPPSAKATP